MIKSILFIGVLLAVLNGCTRKVGGVYRYYAGIKDNYKIWLVDGNRVRQEIFSSFLYGGNEQRYPFNPRGEIWIDNAISCEEYYFTLAHELNERHLMAKFGWTYYAAHDSSLSLEQAIRHKNEEACRAHEASLGKVAVTDYSNVKEIKGIPDSICLQGIYRVPVGVRDGISIWVVDGYLIRKNIYPDFGFSANDLSCHFIPSGEIWIDGQVSCEETEYSIAVESEERKLMKSGKSYDDAYTLAIDKVQKIRKSMANLSASHYNIQVPDSLTRYRGVIDPLEK